MKVTVLGAGVTGVTTAYFLLKQGHDVTVIDRQPHAAGETSFGNGGQISPTHAKPWAMPGLMEKILASSQVGGSPYGIKLAANVRQWLFGLSFLKHANPLDYIDGARRGYTLAAFSQDVLTDLVSTLDLDYEKTPQGIMTVFDDNQLFNESRRTAEKVVPYGADIQELSVEACLAIEPSLTPAADRLVGALWSPTDGAGNAHTFTTKLAQVCEEMGASFEYGAAIDGVDHRDYRLYAVHTSRGSFEADAFVVSLGSFTAPFCRQLGVGVPIYPLKGHSITIPHGDSTTPHMPIHSLTDESRRLVITPQAKGLRVAGLADLADWNQITLDPKRIDALVHAIQGLFPHMDTSGSLSPWVGLRPMTPDCMPIIGETPLANVYLNSGHGSFGWTMSCGSGRLIADLISDQEMALNLEQFSLNRFSSLVRL